MSKKKLKGRPHDVLEFIEKNTPPDPKEQYRYGDMYSLRDHAIIRKAVQAMEDDDECYVIIAAFWNDLSFERISDQMGVSKSEVLRLYDRALHRIREFCLSDRSFRLSLPVQLPRAA